MSQLLRSIRNSKRQWYLFLLALAVLVIGWPLLTFTPRGQAANPPISLGVDLEYEGVDLDETGSESEVVTNDSDDEIVLTPSYFGGTQDDGTWEYSTDGGTSFTGLTPTNDQLTIPFPLTEQSQSIIVRYTLPDGSCWDIVLRVKRGTVSGTLRETSAASDRVASPSGSGCCTTCQTGSCDECEDPSKKSATRSPSGNSDGGTDMPEVGSLYMEVPLAAFRNEPDLDTGRLFLYLVRPGDNAADITHLKYAGVPTMEILDEEANPATGISYRCVIRQASGFSIEFEVPTGESVGRPTGHYVSSGARIELLDNSVPPSPVTNPASATYIRQYRQSGGKVLYNKASGAIEKFTTRRGRVTNFPDSRFEIVYSDAPTNSKIRQVKTGGGLLDVIETSTREYSIKVYQPGAYETTQTNGVFLINAGATPRRSVVVKSLSTSPDDISISRINDSRTTIDEWTYTTGSNARTWSVARKEGGTTHLEISRTVSRDGASGDLVSKRTWIDPQATGGPSTIYEADIFTPMQPWGSRAASGSDVSETATATSDITRSRTFHTNPSNPGSYGKLASQTLSDDTTREYEYDSAGRMTVRRSAWLDDLDGKVETFSYAPLTSGETVARDDYRPRMTTVTVDGNIVSKTYFSAYFNLSNEYVEIREQGAPPSLTSTFGAGANLRTRTTYWPTTANSARQGRVMSIVRYDGTGTKYDYENNDNGTTNVDHDDLFIVTRESHLNSSLNPVAGFSTKTVTKYDVRGDVVEVTESIYPIGGSAFTPHKLTTHTYDSLGYKILTTEKDLLTNRETEVYSATWTNGRKTGDRSSMGTSYTYGYDELDRQITKTRNAISASSPYPGQDAITTTTDGGMRKSGNGIGWQNITTTVVGGSITLTTSLLRDGRGRVKESTDANGYTTSYSINPSGTSTTTTHPNGETSTTVTYLDGRHKSTVGAAVTPSYSSYSTGAGTITTTRHTLTNPGDRYVTTVSNMLGQVVSTETPALSGVTPATVTTTNHYEEGKGYLKRISSDAANVPHTIMEYNAIGVLTRRGQSQDNDTLTPASDDRITDIVTGVESEGGDLWSIQETRVYPTAGSAATKLVNTSRTQIAGFAGNEYSREETIDINGNMSRTSGTLTLWSGVPSGRLGYFSYSPAYTDSSCTLSFHGRLARSRQPGVGGVTRYLYDSLGRQIRVIDPRHSTYSEKIYQTDSNQIDKVINAKGEETRFTYYAQNSLGAGKISTTTHPDSSQTFTSYDARGRTVASWGSQTYTRWYKYNGYNEMTELRTWQIDPGLTLANVSNGLPPGSATTTWTYDDGSGLVLTKRDADSLGFDYQYDTAGRLSRRTDARTIKTDYTYTAWGELDTVTYTDDPEETRPLDYNYDRLGRLDDVTQTATTGTPGTNTHNFIYDDNLGEDEETNTPDSNDFGNLLLGKEIISYGGGTLAKTLKFRHDTYSRVVKHQLIGGATTEHQVDFGFQDGSGRLSTFTDNTNTARVFTYNYEGDNAHLIKTVVGPVHTVTNSYEADRDILASKVNEETLTTSYPSTFEYTVNSLGQRTNVGPVATLGGNNITTDHPVDWGWNYNGRGEVESADHGDDSVANAKDRFYKFDAIGNRNYLREGVYEDLNGTQRQYTANNLNEYGDVDTNGTQVSQGYDASGNMTSGQVPSYQGSSSTLTWDAESRLIEAVVDGVTTTYEYDYMGRRIRKEVQGTSTVTTRYVYHGWNVCAEYTGTALNKTYTWGMDLSGSMQGAGGVGGLLMVTDDPAGTAPDEYYPTYDGNGNVTEYLDSSGSVVAHYEYDAFGGEAATPTGSLAGTFSHRFSTKYLDDETGLYYYGFRFYDPVTGRWPSRDPIGEEGGINLYGMVGNDSINGIDYLGMKPAPEGFEWVPRLVGVKEEELINKDNAQHTAFQRINNLNGKFDWRLKALVEFSISHTSALSSAAVQIHGWQWQAWGPVTWKYMGFEDIVSKEAKVAIDCDENGMIGMSGVLRAKSSLDTVYAQAVIKAISGGDYTTARLSLELSGSASTMREVKYTTLSGVEHSFEGSLTGGPVGAGIGGRFTESLTAEELKKFGISNEAEAIYHWKCVCVKKGTK